MKNYITESWLRAHLPQQEGAALQLPEGAVLTPAAETFVSERHLQVRYSQALEQRPGPVRGNAVSRINPLTGTDHAETMHCTLCRQTLEKKPDTLTHLNADRLVAKNDPRIRFRGRLDTAIAQSVLTQAELNEKGTLPVAFMQCLADVRSALGNVLKAEVTGEMLAPLYIGAFDAKAIHRLSHAPLKYLGHDHIVPEASQGLTVARLNLLRAVIREAELAGADIFITRDFEVMRPDIMEGLNRLSSAVYVLMIVALMLERGMTIKEGKWN